MHVLECPGPPSARLKMWAGPVGEPGLRMRPEVSKAGGSQHSDSPYEVAKAHHVYLYLLLFVVFI